jgi:acyl-coenzyme A synthetase/AMP-(fatty) acid ligase
MGKPSPGIELAILDSKGDAVVNTEGEISVLITPTSDHLIFKGYRRGTDGNVQIVRPEVVDKQGRRWYSTGDRGIVDDDGYFWFVGRDDDVQTYAMRLTLGNKLLRLPYRSI